MSSAYYKEYVSRRTKTPATPYGQALRAFRESVRGPGGAPMTQNEMAETTGISRQTINAVELGKRPARIETLAKLRAAFPSAPLPLDDGAEAKAGPSVEYVIPRTPTTPSAGGSRPMISTEAMVVAQALDRHAGDDAGLRVLAMRRLLDVLDDVHNPSKPDAEHQGTDRARHRQA